jgi:hypothetical protein
MTPYFYYFSCLSLVLSLRRILLAFEPSFLFDCVFVIFMPHLLLQVQVIDDIWHPIQISLVDVNALCVVGVFEIR